MSKGAPTIVLLDLSANVLVVVVVLLVVAMMRPVPPTELNPVAVPIIAEAPTGAVPLIDALFGRTQPSAPRRAIDLTEAGVLVVGDDGVFDLRSGAANFAAALTAALGGPNAAIDIFVFDAEHHAVVRDALGERVDVREVTVPEALRGVDGGWDNAFASLFGRTMTEAEFRGRLTRLLAGAAEADHRREAASLSLDDGERWAVEWLVLSGRLLLFVASLVALWRAPALGRRLAGE